MRLAFAAGDVAGRLGWRPPIRSTAALEMTRGAVGDPVPWTRLTGITRRSLRSVLAGAPASVQKRWFARLYLLKPVIFAVLALFWIGTAIMALGPGWSMGLSLIRGRRDRAARVIGRHRRSSCGPLHRHRHCGAADIPRSAPCGHLDLPRLRRDRYVARPRLWADPLGPMLKIWPVLVLNVVALAIVEDR
jgi:hypothetical protein